MKLIIQMPCYNEAETLAIALNALPRKVEGFDTVEWLIIDELTQMANYDFITPEVFDSVSRLPIDMSNYGVRDHISGPATYFREILRMELREWCQNHVKSDGTPYDLYKDGLKIYTVQYSVDLPTGDIWSPRNSSSKRIGEEVTLQWALAREPIWPCRYGRSTCRKSIRIHPCISARVILKNLYSHCLWKSIVKSMSRNGRSVKWTMIWMISDQCIYEKHNL